MRRNSDDALVKRVFEARNSAPQLALRIERTNRRSLIALVYRNAVAVGGTSFSSLGLDAMKHARGSITRGSIVTQRGDTDRSIRHSRITSFLDKEAGPWQGKLAAL